MGLGPSGSLPHSYYCTVLPYILAIIVCVCVCVCVDFFVRVSTKNDNENDLVYDN